MNSEQRTQLKTWMESSRKESDYVTGKNQAKLHSFSIRFNLKLPKRLISIAEIAFDKIKMGLSRNEMVAHEMIMMEKRKHDCEVKEKNERPNGSTIERKNTMHDIDHYFRNDPIIFIMFIGSD